MGLVVVAAVALAGVTGRGLASGDGKAVSGYEARGVIARIERVVTDAQGRPEAATFCASTSSDQTMCRMSLDQVAFAYPVRRTDVVKTQPLDDGSMIVWLSGALSNGEEFRSFVQIIREGGGLTAVDGVYRASREFTQDPVAQPGAVGAR